MVHRKIDASFTRRNWRKLKLNIDRHNRKMDRANRQRALRREVHLMSEPLRDLADRLTESEEAVRAILDECDDVLQEPNTHDFFTRLRDSEWLTARGDLAELARLELENTVELLEDSKIELTRLQELMIGTLRVVDTQARKISVVLKVLDAFLSILPPLPSEADPTEADQLRHLSGAMANRERVKVMARINALRKGIGESIARDLAPIRDEMKRIAQRVASFRIRHGV
jgi:hypothetical protein